jgi:hypothetical protein
VLSVRKNRANAGSITLANSNALRCSTRNSRQARAYAEYRVFEALARHTPRVCGARVVLRRDERTGTCDTVVCAVTVALELSGSVRTRSRGLHAYRQ